MSRRKFFEGVLACLCRVATDNTLTKSWTGTYPQEQVEAIAANLSETRRAEGFVCIV